MDLDEIRSSDSWKDAKELFDLFEPCKACGAIKFRFSPEDDIRWSAPGTYREYVAKTDDIGKQRAPARPVTACGDCGSIDDPGSMSTESRIQAIENMADAVEDTDVEIDIEAAVEAAIAARSDPDLTGRDDQVFVAALATALD